MSSELRRALCIECVCRQHCVEVKYYADGENGLELHHQLTRTEVGLPEDPADELSSLGDVPRAAAANGRPLPGCQPADTAAADDKKAAAAPASPATGGDVSVDAPPAPKEGAPAGAS